MSPFGAGLKIRQVCWTFFFSDVVSEPDAVLDRPTLGHAVDPGPDDEGRWIGTGLVPVNS